MDDESKKFTDLLIIKSPYLRALLGEFVGTSVYVLGGDATMATCVFMRDKCGPTYVPLGWSASLVVAVYVTIGVSGAHLNPAATLAYATIGKFPWKKVLPYMSMQFLGAFVSSVVLYCVYYEALNNHDGGIRQTLPHPNATSHIFACYPGSYASAITCFIDQLVGTGLLLLSACSFADDRNEGPTKPCIPIALGFTLFGILFGFGMNCMAPLNPARDLSPRFFTLIAGWGIDVFSVNNYNWFWIPIMGPLFGGIIGAWIYLLFIENHWPDNTYDLKDSGLKWAKMTSHLGLLPNASIEDQPPTDKSPINITMSTRSAKVFQTLKEKPVKQSE